MPREPEYDVIWNGTKDARGECPALSGYTGGSTLTNTPADRWAHGDRAEVLHRALSKPGPWTHGTWRRYRARTGAE